MDKLPPEISALVEAARSAHEPTPEDRERVRVALAAAIAGSSIPPPAIGPAADSGGSAFSSGASRIAGGLTEGKTAWLGLGPKLLVIVAVVSAMGGLLAYRYRLPAEERLRPETSGRIYPADIHPGIEAKISQSSKASPTSAANPPSGALANPVTSTPLPGGSERVRAVTAPGPALEPRQGAGTTREIKPAAPGLQPSARTTGAIEPKAPLSRETATATGSLEPTPAAHEPPAADLTGAEEQPVARNLTGQEELLLIRAATQALRDDQPYRALSALDEHASCFPQGKLQQERRALRVLALCRLGQVEQALRERDRFLSETPDSPYGERLRAACANPPSPAPANK